MSNEVRFFERAQPGWRMIGPGIYIDQENNMHIFSGEILRGWGIPDTAENRRMIEEVGPAAVRAALGNPELPAFITSPEGVEKA